MYVVSGPVTVALKNTILAGNTASSGPDCWGSIGSGGYNLVGDTSGCTFTPGIGDLTHLNARLSQLIGPPGVPRYHPLLSGSPAIDAGNPAGCAGSTGPLATDQRGAARVGRCDIGAYEYTTPGPAASVYAHAGTPQRASPLRAFAVPFQAGVLDGIGSPVSNAIVAFSAPASGPSGTFADTGTYTTTATTGEGGVATAATFTANGLLGTYTVTAAASGVVTPIGYLLTNAWLYVAPGGNDLINDCQRPANACATISGALGKASPGDTIYVAIGTYTWTGKPIALLDKSVNLPGGWNSAFTAQSGMSTIEFDRGEECQGITVQSGIAAVVERFTVHGAPICNDGVLTVDRCTVTAGSVGIHNTGILTLSHSVVSGNHGDGIHNEGTLALNDITASGNGDTGVHNAPNSNATLNDVTLSGNVQRGIANDADATMIVISTTIQGNSRAGILNNGILTLTHSAVISNTTSEAGGGILNGGTLTLHDSTVSDNAVYGPGGGIYNGGTAILNNSTVSGNRTDPNSGGSGGGIYDEVAVTLRNTIVAGNRAREGGPDCSGTIHSTGYNLIGNTSGCMFSATTGDILNVNAALFPSLIGVPGYHPLLFYSPAIDAGNPAGCADHLGNPLDADQRGVARVGRCDVGAYEFDPARDPLSYAIVPVVTRNYCLPLYADDFDDSGSGWPVEDGGDVLYEYLDSEYRILVRSAHWSALARPGFKASSYTVAVDVRHATLEYGSAGIVFGLADDWSQFYLFEVDAGSGYTIWRYASGSGWRRLAFGYSPFINPSYTTKRLKVDRDGASIRVYLDGHLLASLTDGSYTGSRHVGLYAAAYDSPNVDIRFDNFVVYPLQCGPTVTAVGETSGTFKGRGLELQSAGTWEGSPYGTGR